MGMTNTKLRHKRHFRRQPLMVASLLFMILSIVCMLLQLSPTAIISERETISIQPSVMTLHSKEEEQQHNNNKNHVDNIIISSQRKSRWVQRYNINNTTTTKNNTVVVDKDDAIMGQKKQNAAIVISKYKLIFFAIQKCGGTVWKQLFRRIEGHDDWRTGTTWGKNVGIKYLNEFSVEEATTMMNDPTWIRAIMVRDPKERLLSSYLDKAVQTNYFKKICCRHHICQLTKKTDRISLKKFVDVTQSCHDKHWMPQTTKLESKYLTLLDFIGHLETAYDDAKQLLQKVGAWDEYGLSGWGKYGNESIFQSTSFVEHKTSTATTESKSRLAIYYSPELERTVEERYKMDYDIFDLPITKIKYS